MPEFSSPGGDGAIVSGGNTAAVLAAAADNVDETENPLYVYAALAGFDGSTLDMIRAEDDQSDGVTAAALGRLSVIARLFGWNGGAFDRLTSEGNDRDAIAVATLGKLEAIIYGHLFNGTTWDRQRALGSTSLEGLGQASVSSAVPGASAVKMNHVVLNNTSSPTTVATPASGKRIRLISYIMDWDDLTVGACQIYFGSGSSILSDITKAVGEYSLEVDINPTGQEVFADGAGPAGAVDEVLTVHNGNATGDNTVTVKYREE